MTKAKGYFDSLRLAQVIDNVLSNAIKFNIENGWVETVLRDDGESLILEVTNSGPGIRPEDRPKVFNEFESVENIKNHQKGTGLGMPIGKRLMEVMGGHIDFESTVGRSTTFRIVIPMKRVLEGEMYRPRPTTITREAA
jgi:signal transduction histidine kinase